MSMQIGLAACVFRSIEMLSVARSCGFDFLLADMEHGAMSLGEASALCVAGIEAGYPVYVRAPGATSEYLSRIVDCGASGLLVPHVDSAAQARSVIDRVRFAPVGARSIPSPLPVAGFQPLPPAELIAKAQAALTVWVMIESAEALAAIDDIAAVDGLDGLVIGTNDLAQSLGRVGQLDHPDVFMAFRTVARAGHSAGRKFGAMGLPENFLDSHARALGADWLVATNEINLLVEAGQDCVARLRTPQKQGTEQQ